VRARYRWEAALIGISLIWGATFTIVKDDVARMPPFLFIGIRFALATAVLAVIGAFRGLTLREMRLGLVTGTALFAGYAFQTVGLQYTTASNAGFITGMFVVLTPLGSALLLRSRVPLAAWGAVALATAGLALLSLHGLSIGYGELLTLGCAAAFALHIVGLGQWAGSYDAFGLAVVQLATTAVMCAVVAVPGGVVVPPTASVWGALAVTALGATALAFVVQTWAQSILAPTRAAVIMTMEPVFSGFFAVALAGERLGLRALLGAVLVLVAMLLTEVGPRHGAEGSVSRLEV
jgi:drug/metabolite transporter (DMT)-like permease